MLEDFNALEFLLFARDRHIHDLVGAFAKSREMDEIIAEILKTGDWVGVEEGLSVALDKAKINTVESPNAYYAAVWLWASWALDQHREKGTARLGMPGWFKILDVEREALVPFAASMNALALLNATRSKEAW